jgi:long-chain acyl-CoA synthetase
VNITERVWGLYLGLATRCISNFPERPDTIFENLQELQPTVLGADAEAWDRLHALATRRAQAATRTQRMIYDWGLRSGKGGGPARMLANVVVLHAVRREFGLNRLRLAYVGGTAVNPAALDWAKSLGIAIQRLDEPMLRSGKVDERYQTLMQNAYA